MSANFASYVKQFKANQLIWNLFENKIDLNKVKVSLLNEEKGNKNFFGCYATWLEEGTYAFTNIGVKISKHIEILPWNHLSCEREFSNPV